MLLAETIHIGIVGSRRRDTARDLQEVRHALITEMSKYAEKEIVIVSGGCPKGGDRFAEMLAEELDLRIVIHHPNRSSLPNPPHPWDFARINYERNTLIARDSDILIACVASDRKGGTEDTIKKYLKMGKNELILV